MIGESVGGAFDSVCFSGREKIWKRILERIGQIIIGELDFGESCARSSAPTRWDPSKNTNWGGGVIDTSLNHSITVP